MLTPPNRQRASHYTHAAQAGAAVLLLASLGVAAVGLPFARTPKAPGEVTVPEIKVDRTGTRRAADSQAVDLDGISSRLNGIGNPPTLVAAEQPKATPGSTAPPPPATTPAEFRYLGAAQLGPLRMALVSDQGKQRFVGVGDTVSAGEVRAIEDRVLRVDNGGVTSAIDLAPRGTDAVTRTAARTAVNRPGMNGMNGAIPQGRGGAQPTQGFPSAMSATTGLTVSPGSVPEYVSGEHASQYERIRDQLKGTGKFTSEEELNETAAKVLEQELMGMGEKKKE